MARILLVDNRTDVLNVSANILEDEGYQVERASSPEEARIAHAPNQFDMAIIDIHLINDMDALDVSGLRLAEEISRSTPVILITGNSNEHLALAALRPRGNHPPIAVNYVKKIDGQNALLTAVRSNLKRRVFIVHGHNDLARLAVRGLIEKLGLRPVILQDEPGLGQSVLEKIETHSDVSFAVVLLTPDDVGGPKGSTVHRPRARQNVIFELGFFVGRLGPRHVAALYRWENEPLDFPSDYTGILYLPLDTGGVWEMKLAREIEAAGVPVSFEKLLHP